MHSARPDPRPLRMLRRGAARWAVASVAAALLGACAYRMDIQQGNVVEPEAIEQVEVGMTRSQVQFLLGTPMVSDTFHDNRWDYTYYLREGRDDDIDRRWFVVYFEGDRVVRLEQQIRPEEDAQETAS